MGLVEASVGAINKLPWLLGRVGDTWRLVSPTSVQLSQGDKVYMARSLPPPPLLIPMTAQTLALTLISNTVMSAQKYLHKHSGEVEARSSFWSAALSLGAINLPRLEWTGCSSPRPHGHLRLLSSSSHLHSPSRWCCQRSFAFQAFALGKINHVMETKLWHIFRIYFNCKLYFPWSSHCLWANNSFI